MPPHINFGETTRDLEQFVKEIGSVESMMRARLMELVRALEAQNKEDKAAKTLAEEKLQQMTRKYEKLEHDQAELVNRYNTLNQHVHDLLLERELLKRRLNSAIQYSQMLKEEGGSEKNSAITGMSDAPKKAHLNQFLPVGANGDNLKTGDDKADITVVPVVLTKLPSPSSAKDEESPHTTQNELSDDASYVNYSCPMYQCKEVFPFPKKFHPPLHGNGKVSDRQRWKPELFAEQIQAVQQHVKKRHATALPETKWPVGFAKRPRQNHPKEIYNWYLCPIKTCPHKMEFTAAQLAPLDSNGNVSDAKPWPNMFADKIERIRNHMKKCHPTVPPGEWPAGFAMPKEVRIEFHKYKCPIEGCSRVFDIAKNLQPPLNAKGDVTDSESWDQERLGPVIESVTRHLLSSHPEVSERDWPASVARDSADTENESSDDDHDEHEDDHYSVASKDAKEVEGVGEIESNDDMLVI